MIPHVSQIGNPERYPLESLQMSRKQDINQGAVMAVLVLSGFVGLFTWSFWVAVITFFIFSAILSAMKIIR